MTVTVTTTILTKERMKALVWRGSNSVDVEFVDKPQIIDDRDAIVKITSTTICGSDLHLYRNTIKGMKSGDILGHEAMGIVEEVGPGINQEKLGIGERVVISAVIADGTCEYCERGEFGLCDGTNPSVEQEEIMGGHRTAGVFGYSHLTGGYDGCQAQYVRVPFADVNCLRIGPELPDEKVLFLSDVYCTAWQANEFGNVNKDSIVAVWGLGPVGLMALAWAKYRGAKRIIGIDNVPYRIAKAKGLGCEVLNFDECDVKKTLLDVVPGGPTVCIECVGFDYSKTWRHSIERSLKMETDVAEAVGEAIYSVKKGGIVVVMGVYIGLANHFPIGPLMEKGVTLRGGGQVYVQRYWNDLIGKLKEIDTSFLLTHKVGMDELPKWYKNFYEKSNDVLKVLVRPWE